MAQQQMPRNRSVEGQRFKTNAQRDLKKLTSNSSHQTSNCIEDKNGNIIMEKQKVLERWSEYIEQLYDDEQGIYSSTIIPEDLLKSVFVTIPKKQGTTKCELHRAISLMSCITKVLLKVIMRRSKPQN